MFLLIWQWVTFWGPPCRLYCRSTYCVHLTSQCLELSSADTERELISNYNKLVCSSGVALSDESVQGLHSTLMDTLIGVFQAIKMVF